MYCYCKMNCNINFVAWLEVDLLLLHNLFEIILYCRAFIVSLSINSRMFHIISDFFGCKMGKSWYLIY